MITKLPAILTSLIILLIMPVSVFAGNAILSLSPSTGTFNKGCSYTVDVVLDTGGAQTDGTDAIIKFDQAIFNVNSTLKPGTIYSDYPGNNVDATNGKITISGLASVSSPFSGKGTLGSFTFTVKDTAPTAATQMTFDFDASNKAKTSDSNVVERGTVAEVLNSVVNGNYTIGAGACTGTVSPAPTGTTPPGFVPPGGTYYPPGGTATPSGIIYKPLPPQLPPGGTEQLTATIAIVGSILTVLGILGFVLL